MKFATRSLFVLFMISMLTLRIGAQQVARSPVSSAVVPQLVNFSGKAFDAHGISLRNDHGGTDPLGLEPHCLLIPPPMGPRPNSL